VSDESDDTGKVDEAKLEAAEVQDEDLEDVSGGEGEGSGGAPMQISSPGNPPGQSSINYP
jgi:hypothetical protein